MLYHCRVPSGAVDTILSYCHNNLADQTLLDLLPYLHKKGVGVISASFSSMGLLRKEVRKLQILLLYNMCGSRPLELMVSVSLALTDVDLLTQSQHMGYLAAVLLAS